MPTQQSPSDPTLDDVTVTEREYIKRLAWNEGHDPVRDRFNWWKAVMKYYNLWLNGKLPPENVNRAGVLPLDPPVHLSIDHSAHYHSSYAPHHDHSTHHHDHSQHKFEFGDNNKVNLTLNEKASGNSMHSTEDNVKSPSSVSNKSTAAASRNATGNSGKPTEDTGPSAPNDALVSVDNDESPPLQSHRGGVVGRLVSIFGRHAIRRHDIHGSPQVRFTNVNEAPSRNHQEYSYLGFYRGIQTKDFEAKKAVRRGEMTRTEYDRLVQSLQVTHFNLAGVYLGRVFVQFCVFFQERWRLLSSLGGNPYAMSKPKKKTGTNKKTDPKKTVEEIEELLEYVMTRIGHPNPRDRDALFLETAVLLLKDFPATFAAMNFAECWGLGLVLSEFNTKYFHSERPVLLEYCFKMTNKVNWWRKAYRLDVELERVRSENEQLTHAVHGQVDEVNKIVSANNLELGRLRSENAQLRHQLQLAQQGQSYDHSHAKSYDPSGSFDPDSTSEEDFSSVDYMDEFDC